MATIPFQGLCPGDLIARINMLTAGSNAEQALEIAELKSKLDTALQIPPYTVAQLPWAAAYPNRLVIVTDDPQGTARSVPVGDAWHWLSEVDGSDLGAGNAPSA